MMKRYITTNGESSIAYENVDKTWIKTVEVLTCYRPPKSIMVSWGDVSGWYFAGWLPCVFGG